MDDIVKRVEEIEAQQRASLHDLESLGTQVDSLFGVVDDLDQEVNRLGKRTTALEQATPINPATVEPGMYQVQWLTDPPSTSQATLWRNAGGRMCMVCPEWTQPDVLEHRAPQIAVMTRIEP